MPELMVNIDHVATLREARGIHYPDPVFAAGIAEMAGATGIIIHLREDRRHIKDRDLRILRDVVGTKLNLEMAATPEMTILAIRTMTQCLPRLRGLRCFGNTYQCKFLIG